MDSLAAAAANCRCSRVVYVGNIAFHAADKEVLDACELIGPVLSFRLAADAATGKRKGYAFVEYADDATAQSACRNLHGHLLRGRELRVGLADRTGASRSRCGDHDPVGMDDAIHAASLVDFSGQRHAAAVASVTRYLAGLSRHQLREAAAAFEGYKVLKEHVPGPGHRHGDGAAPARHGGRRRCRGGGKEEEAGERLCCDGRRSPCEDEEAGRRREGHGRRSPCEDEEAGRRREGHGGARWSCLRLRDHAAANASS